MFARQARAQTCPMGSQAAYEITSGSFNDGGNGFNALCPIGSKHASETAALNACFPQGRKSTAGDVQIGAIETLGGSYGTKKMIRVSDGGGVGAVGVAYTQRCEAPQCPAAGTPFETWPATIPPEVTNGCHRIANGQLCLVVMEIGMRVIGGTGSYTYNDGQYTGAMCATETPEVTPPPNPVPVDNQLIKLTRGTFSVVKWETAGLDVTLPNTDHNKQTAYANGNTVRGEGSAALTPSGGYGPVTVTTYGPGGQATTVNLYAQSPLTLNNYNANYQSGGPAGGGGPPGTNAPRAGDTRSNAPVTSTVTNVIMGNGATTTTTNNYNSVTNSTTTTTTTKGPDGTTSTTSPPTPGPPQNNPPPNPPQPGGGGGGGAPGGDDGGTGTGDEGDGEGDCTGPNCGDGSGGQGGEFNTPGGEYGFEDNADDVAAANEELATTVSDIRTEAAGMFGGISGGSGSLPSYTFSLACCGVIHVDMNQHADKIAFLGALLVFITLVLSAFIILGAD